ncbi:MAG: hypothetical protein LWY06_16480 [Firmicutes bacterium]|nr:hypothetical protein [Bacillota bacterium]
MRRFKQKGYVLILAVIVMMVLIYFSAMYLNFFSAEHRIAMNGEQKLIAIEAANAGIEDALYYISTDKTWSTGLSDVSLPHSGAKYTVTFTKSSTVPYSTNNISGSSTVTGYNGRQVPAGFIHIVSVGTFGRNSDVEEALLSGGSTSYFTVGTFIRENIAISGSHFFDSYDSSKGTYSATATTTGGDVRTNSALASSVVFSGYADVRGNIIAGTGGSAASTLVTNGVINYKGFSTATPTEFTFPSPTVGTSKGDFKVSAYNVMTLSPGTYDSIDIKGASVITLTEGDYVIKGTLDIGASANIKITPGSKVRIYVLGQSMDFSGSCFTNDSQIPGNFLIFGGPNCTSVSMSGYGNQYVGLYAPNAALKISGSMDLYGAIVGKTLDLSGYSFFHYDKALGNTSSSGSASSGTMTIKSRW